MNPLILEIAENQRDFEPGDEITGKLGWDLPKAPRNVELRLFWFTKGKGTEDAGVVDTLRFEHPSMQETHAFRFRLPEAPYSFSGRLITLIWALELVAAPSKEVARLEFVMAPGGHEVRLGGVPESQQPHRAAVWGKR